MSEHEHLHLAVALEGAGWHPAAWRLPTARPDELLTARYWRDLVSEAERGLLDFVTFEDGFAIAVDHHQTDQASTNRVAGRLDAQLLAARVAPTTNWIGLIPSVVAPLSEPFHTSKSVATLDFVSRGRAGVRVRTSSNVNEYRNIGRRQAPIIERDASGRLSSSDHLVADLFAEVGDYIEVLRRLWDSWEDGAEIRDVETGRFIDRDKLHYIDFEGSHFAVRGPSITPRPPQGQPLVAVLAHQVAGHRLLAENADIGFLTPADSSDVRREVESVRTAAVDRRCDPETIKTFADLVVFLDVDSAEAVRRKEQLDEWSGAEFGSDAAVFAGTTDDLADLLREWQKAGIDGIRLRPAAVPHDLLHITESLVPKLQSSGHFRSQYTADTLRGHFGLPRPANRYATA